MYTADDYLAEFNAERESSYPQVAAFENEMKFALTRSRLENAALWLACPIKAHPACWQHGRVVYSALRAYLASHDWSWNEKDEIEPVTCLDVGTAKGFSALMMQYAIDDALSDYPELPKCAYVTSCDVIDPDEKRLRNCYAEAALGGPQSVFGCLGSFPERDHIVFKQCTGVELIESAGPRVGFAFLDGKHTYSAVWDELNALRQKPGDVVVLDDIQVDGVKQALERFTAERIYSAKIIEAKPAQPRKDRPQAPRAYAYAVRL